MSCAWRRQIPLKPDRLLRHTSPEIDFNNIASFEVDWFSKWELYGRPGGHVGCVRWRIYAQNYVFVESGIEVTGKSIQNTILSHIEGERFVSGIVEDFIAIRMMEFIQRIVELRRHKRFV